MHNVMAIDSIDYHLFFHEKSLECAQPIKYSVCAYCLFVLMLYIPVDNFSVSCLPGLNHYYSSTQHTVNLVLVRTLE